MAEEDFVCGSSEEGTEFIRTVLLAGITRANIGKKYGWTKAKNNVTARKREKHTTPSCARLGTGKDEGDPFLCLSSI